MMVRCASCNRNVSIADVDQYGVCVICEKNNRDRTEKKAKGKSRGKQNN